MSVYIEALVKALLIGVALSVEVDPATTSGYMHYESGVMFKVYFDFYQRYISRIDVFEPIGWIILQGETILNSTNTRQYVCSILTSSECDDVLPTVPTSPAACEAQLEELPVFSPPGTYADGNSQSCRALHASLAASRPALHCPHVSFESIEDPNGKFKCQQSENLQISDLFSEDDLATWDDYAQRQGYPPELGYKFLD